MANIKRKVGNNVKNLRSANGYTLEKMAKTLHMDKKTYRSLERGREEFNYRQIISICSTLDVTPNDIFDIDDLHR